MKPIRPMLHKFNYVPVGAADPGRGRGAFCRRSGRGRGRAEQGGGRGYRRSGRGRDRAAHRRSPMRGGALAAGAPVVHAEAPANVIVEGRIKTPDFDATRAAAHTRIKFEARSRRQNATPLEARGRTRGLRRRDRPRHADLHHPDAASDADRDRRRARHAGIRPARDCARRRRRVRPEDVARRRNT